MTETKQSTIDKAHDLYVQKYPDGRLWWGNAGEPLTGEQVAAHADAAAEHAADAGATLSYTAGPGAVAGKAVHTDGTRYAVGAIIELLLRAATGAPYADAWSWYLQDSLTADEARAMYADVAVFARRYGPEAA
ncbi:hypothetical protein AB0B15_14275 [Streptomyces sp. NPDC045456]|uniref:hypothetical protein n=1 Tax=Streptomyces sp. NPDC045456 TaxID=3155254 RepID=UPI0033F36E20